MELEEQLQLLLEKVISEYDVAYVYQYNMWITLAERDALAKIHYRFKDVRVK